MRSPLKSILSVASAAAIFAAGGAAIAPSAGASATGSCAAKPSQQSVKVDVASQGVAIDQSASVMMNAFSLENAAVGRTDLEAWSVGVLENIASVEGVPSIQMVTLSNVQALVAFGVGEGGGQNGAEGMYNPTNAKSAKFGGTPTSDGATVDNTSMADGVDADAQVMEMGHYSRLVNELVPGTNPPVDFFEALANPDGTPGNVDWSADDASHLSGYEQIVGNVQANWTTYANVSIDN